MTNHFRVNSGDIISADFMNVILTRVDTLEEKVRNLEQSSSPAGVIITDVVGPDPFRIGDRVHVLGRNFSQPAEANTVTVGGERVQSFAFGGSDQELIFDLPAVSNLNQNGSPVLVVVQTAGGAMASYQIILHPALILPAGRIEVTYSMAPVMPEGQLNIIGNNNYVFTFDVTTFVDLNATYTLVPVITGVTGWTASVIEGSSITVPGDVNGITRLIGVRVSVPNGAAVGDIGQLRLEVEEDREVSRINPGHEDITITVGSPPPTPETRVRISLRSDVADLTFTRPSSNILEFNISVTEAGIYSVTAEMRNPQGWNIREIDFPTFPINDPAGGNQVISVDIEALASAQITDLVLTVTRPETATPAISVSYSQGLEVA